MLLYAFREELFGTDVPVRIAAAILLAALGWRFARDLGRALGPRLLARFDPGTAVDGRFPGPAWNAGRGRDRGAAAGRPDPRAIALGGAVTAVVLGLAAQSTLGNLIAGMVLLGSRPFQIGERVGMQGGTLGGEVEGTVASLGLIYTTLARGEERLLVPNNAVLRPASCRCGSRQASTCWPGSIGRQAQRPPAPARRSASRRRRVTTPTSRWRRSTATA